MFLPSLVEIGTAVLAKILNVVNIFSLFLYHLPVGKTHFEFSSSKDFFQPNVVEISPVLDFVNVHLNLKPLHSRMPFAKFG